MSNNIKTSFAAWLYINTHLGNEGMCGVENGGGFYIGQEEEWKEEREDERVVTSVY